MLKIVYRKVEFGDLKLPVAPNNGDRHFSKLFNVEKTNGIIHSRIIPAIKALPNSGIIYYINIDQLQFYH